MAVLPQKDLTYLEEKGFKYRIGQYGAEIHLVLEQWPFPPAYSPQQSDLLIVIPPAYPLAALDMFWTYPDIHLVSGAWPQAGDQHQVFADGRNWQRWSRHISWRSGVDSLQTFITAVKSEISKGI